MVVQPRKPQTLKLLTIFDAVQTYIPVAAPQDVTSRVMGPDFLSNDYLDDRAKAILEQDPSLQQQREGYFVLEEGLVDASSIDLGKLLVVMQYDFTRRSPLIEVPGRYVNIDHKNDGIVVSLLNDGEQIKFVSGLLGKEYNLIREHVYTGEYKIWPGKITVRKSKHIKI